MFVIKYDKVSMIRLVQCIEKYPAIYDTKNHFSKEEQDAAWDKIAIEVGEKDSLCRDRWHSIKSCYIRHLKYTALNSKRRPYYLAEFLDFMLPFVSDKIKSFLASKRFQLDNLPSYLREALPRREPFVSYNRAISKDLALKSESSLIKEEIVDVEEISETEWLSLSSEIEQPSSSQGVRKKSSKTVTNVIPPKKSKTVKVNSSQSEDVKFFKSLLPEIARMSSHQKLKFKQEALSIIEDILYATEEVNITD